MATETFGLTWCNLFGIGALEVPFQVKLTKMLLINPRLAKSQSWSKSVQNNIFHVFILIGQELLTPCDELTN